MLSLLTYFKTGKDLPQSTDVNYINETYAYHRKRIIWIITLCYGLGYVCRLAFNVVKKPLMDNGIFTAEEVGIIGSALLYGYALGKFTNGFLADHAHVGRFFALGIFMSAMSNVGMSFSELAWFATVMWGLNGWFQGFGAPSCVVSLASWYTNHERGTYYGIWSTAHSIGEGITYLGIAWLIADAPKGLGLDWQWGFWLPAVICIFAAIIIYRHVPDRPQTIGLPTVANWSGDHGAEIKSKASDNVWKTQLKVLVIPSIWILALASASMYVTRYAINSWGNVYLQEMRGFDLFDANLFIFFNTVSGIIGCVVFGLVSDKIFNSRRPPTNLVFGLIELLPLLVIFYGPQNIYLLAVSLVVYGFGLSGILASLGGLFAIDIAPKKVAGAAMGFIGIFSYIGAGLQDYISGKLIHNSEIQVVFTNTANDYTVYFYNYDKPIVFWVGASVLSFILATSLWKVKVAE